MIGRRDAALFAAAERAGNLPWALHLVADRIDDARRRRFAAFLEVAQPAIVILLVGYACANIFNWNRPLLLALGRPRYPLIVAGVVGAVELILLFTLVPRGSYLTASAIFSGYLAISILWMVWRGLTLIPGKEAMV